MIGKIRHWFLDQLAQNIRLPQKSIIGWITTKGLVRENRFLEENAVRLCNLNPDHKVLELGFGPGIGIEAAYKVVQNGGGVVYGIDPSFYMLQSARRRLEKPVQEKKVVLIHGNAGNIPLNTDSIHRVFHCNCYYFWPSMRLAMREIYRVLRPGGVMVTTIDLQSIKSDMEKGLMKYAHADPVKYMACLERYGFDNVHIEYHKDPQSGKEFQAIISEVLEKPAHDMHMLSDAEDEEDLTDTESPLDVQGAVVTTPGDSHHKTHPLAKSQPAEHS